MQSVQKTVRLTIEQHKKLVMAVAHRKRKGESISENKYIVEALDDKLKRKRK